MKTYLLVILGLILLGIYAYAELPHTVNDRQNRDNFEYIDAKLSLMRANSKTRAQLLAYTPSSEGELWYCSDCSPKKLAVSVGTTRGSFLTCDGSAF